MTTNDVPAPVPASLAGHAIVPATDFLRVNHAQPRQAGHVLRERATVRLLRGRCHATVTVDLDGTDDEIGHGSALRLGGTFEHCMQLDADSGFKAGGRVGVGSGHGFIP